VSKSRELNQPPWLRQKPGNWSEPTSQCNAPTVIWWLGLPWTALWGRNRNPFYYLSAESL